MGVMRDGGGMARLASITIASLAVFIAGTQGS